MLHDRRSKPKAAEPEADFHNGSADIALRFDSCMFAVFAHAFAYVFCSFHWRPVASIVALQLCCIGPTFSADFVDRSCCFGSEVATHKYTYRDLTLATEVIWNSAASILIRTTVKILPELGLCLSICDGSTFGFVSKLSLPAFGSATSRTQTHARSSFSLGISADWLTLCQHNIVTIWSV